MPSQSLRAAAAALLIAAVAACGADRPVDGILDQDPMHGVLELTPAASAGVLDTAGRAEHDDGGNPVILVKGERMRVRPATKPIGAVDTVARKGACALAAVIAKHRPANGRACTAEPRIRRKPPSPLVGHPVLPAGNPPHQHS